MIYIRGSCHQVSKATAQAM